MSRIHARFLWQCGAALGLAAGLVALHVGPAQALEDQLSVDLSGGYVLVSEAPELSHAAAFDVGAAMGLGAEWAVRGALGAQAWSAPQGHVRPVARALAELTYALDVLSLVPSFGAGASVWLVSRAAGRAGSETAAVGAGHLVLSLDYLLSRSLNLGLDLREHVLFPLGRPSFATEAKLRLSWLFELF